jgi:hypothetical protein
MDLHDMTDDFDLRILRLDLFKQSMLSDRILNGGHPNKYPVKVWFSRRLSPYEQVALKRAKSPFVVNDRDPIFAAIEDTTLEDVRDQLPNLNFELQAAVYSGRQLREEAEAEDERLRALATEISTVLVEEAKETYAKNG